MTTVELLTGRLLGLLECAEELPAEAALVALCDQLQAARLNGDGDQRLGWIGIALRILRSTEPDRAEVGIRRARGVLIEHVLATVMNGHGSAG